KDLKGNSTSFVLAADDRFGSRWHELAWEVQDVIVQRILDEEDEETLVAWLGEQHGLTQEQALRVSAARSAISRLAPGYARLSSRATARILPHLVEDVVTFNVAVDRAGYGSHSALTHAECTGEVLAELPYYGEYLQRHVGHGTGLVTDLPADRYGRIANPTVHIALNEVRKVVNSLIGEYGPPTQVIVEVVRDLKLSKDRKDELTKEQALRQKENEGYARQIKELLGIDASRADIQKMRLWVELDRAHPMDRRCPYTGEHISMERLFSPAVEVEHILPFRRTLDDSMNNKTVSMVKANGYKGDRTPYEAFGHSPQPYDYPQMLDRVRAMPKGKAYRFAPDGYERWLREDADFLARALNDTAYLSRIAKEYLELVTPGEVWVVPGRLTGALRHHWGLNSLLHDSGEKNRADHRHHAIDAVVVGLMGRASLQTFANASGRGVTVDRQLTSSPRPEPLVGLRERVRDVVGSIVVSHRPNHGHQRQMNNDTNYGLRGAGYVALRRRLDGYDSVAAVEKAQFADPVLKVRLLKHLGAAEGEQFKDRLATFTQDTGTRRVRVLEKLDTIAIAGNPSAAYRAPTGVKARPDNAVRGVKGDSNYCIEIFVGDKGVWAGEVISTFEAYRIVQEQGADRLRDPALTQSGRPLVMRLMRDDVVRMDIDGQ
ncbi:MAG: type II CRISPR RNA-guided endonuclease Cas9, partial [Actinobacteria bacterium]|nr:type II CRISPR RNA-guided endonuclease Cas9 [Actinomycetota bacterium]